MSNPFGEIARWALRGWAAPCWDDDDEDYNNQNEQSEVQAVMGGQNPELMDENVECLVWLAKLNYPAGLAMLHGGGYGLCTSWTYRDSVRVTSKTLWS